MDFGFFDNENCHDPTWNLALEEYAVRHLDPDRAFLLFYVNAPSVIIGRNQNTLEEIDPDYIAEHGVKVVRRISGGGAVYHDLGNLNFSFIKKYESGRLLNFKEFTDPIVKVLHELGVPAELTGRNDIVAQGRKISGNAQFTTSGRMFSHGTLLFDSNLDDVTAALRVRATKIQSKGVASIRSRVANIVEFLDQPLTRDDFRERLLEGIFESEEFPVRRLTDSERAEVDALAESKYRQWDWNFGQSPEFNVQKTCRFPIGEVDARLDVKDGHVRSIKIYGDFLGFGEIADLESHLAGVRYEPADLAAALEETDVEHYFGGLSREEFVEFLY